MTVVADIKIE